MTRTLTTDVAIIGAGPVGLFAVFELGMLKLSSVLIDALSDIGGQCSALYPEKPIYDIPGHPAIEAGELIARLDTQIAPFAAPRLLGRRVEALTRRPRRFPCDHRSGRRSARQSRDHRRRRRRVRSQPPAIGRPDRRTKRPAPSSTMSAAARNCAANASSSPAAATRPSIGLWR